MKNKTFRLIIALLALVILMTCTGLTGCKKNDSDEGPAADLDKRTMGKFNELSAKDPAAKEGEGVMTVNLFDKGIEYYSIIIAQEHTETQKYAAEELAEYVSLSTGYRPEIFTDNTEETKFEIVVGQTNRDTEYIKDKKANLGSDGYLIAQDHMKLFLTGEADRGTMYAVYSFLENYLGWRFYSSTCEKTRLTGEVNISKDIYEWSKPDFDFRTCYWYDIMNSTDLSAKLKNNFNLADYQGGRFTYAGSLVHTIGALSETGNAINTQPCLTDPQVYETVLRNVRALLTANPNADIISVSQNDSDGAGLGCQCENCKALDEKEGTPMGSLLTFVNKIANDIKDDFPNVYVDTLAYRYTRKPPKNLKPADNVMIRLCSIECCFAHPMDECDKTGFVDDLKGWSEICDNLYIWDYTTNFSNYMAPFGNFNAIRENLQLFKECNVIGVFEQGNYQSYSCEFAELRTYLMSKIMWDTSMTREEYLAHMDDFLQGYYGKGWEYIKKYIFDINNQSICKHIYDGPNTLIDYTALDTPIHRNKIQSYINLWDKALALAENQEEYDRINKSRMQTIYLFMSLDWESTDKDTREKIAEQFYNDCKKYNITMINEARRLNLNLENFSGSIVQGSWGG